MESLGGPAGVSKSRRKTYTLQQSHPDPVSASPLQTSNICNRTFIAGGGGGGDRGGGGGDAAEEIISRKVIAEMKQPLPEPSVLVNNKNNKDPSSSIVTSANLYSLLVQQPRPPPNANIANASKLPLPSLPNGPGPVVSSLSTSTSLFSRRVCQSKDSKPEEFLNRFCARRNANFRKLTGLLCEGVSVMDLTSSSGGSEPMFETSSVGVPKRKPSIELEQLRLKQKSMLDEIKRCEMANTLNEKEQKDTIKKLGVELNDMEEKILKMEKSEKLDKEIEAVTKAATKFQTEAGDYGFKVEVRNAFLHKFLRVDEEYKCKDPQFCKEFHEGGACLPESEPT